MTKKAKKLGVKTNKSVVFTEVFDEEKSGKDDINEQKENEKQDDASSSTAEEDNIDLDKICSTLDKLSLDLLILMQQQIQLKIKIEEAMTEGELHISKTRYIMGHKSVSTLQLPTENGTQIDPSLTIEEHVDDDASMFGNPRLKLNIENFIKPEEKTEESKNVLDPVKWFGVLVPRDLRAAQNKFRNSVEWIVDSANIQIRINQTCEKMVQLEHLKKELRKTNEE